MRTIKAIHVVTYEDGKTYRVGDIVNKIEIKKIIDCSVEFANSLNIGYRCLGGMCDKYKDIVVEMWGAPVVVEYFDDDEAVAG